jgi:hypothetical protein
MQSPKPPAPLRVPQQTPMDTHGIADTDRMNGLERRGSGTCCSSSEEMVVMEFSQLLDDPGRPVNGCAPWSPAHQPTFDPLLRRRRTTDHYEGPMSSSTRVKSPVGGMSKERDSRELSQGDVGAFHWGQEDTEEQTVRERQADTQARWSPPGGVRGPQGGLKNPQWLEVPQVRCIGSAATSNAREIHSTGVFERCDDAEVISSGLDALLGVAENIAATPPCLLSLDAAGSRTESSGSAAAALRHADAAATPLQSSTDLFGISANSRTVGGGYSAANCVLQGNLQGQLGTENCKYTPELITEGLSREQAGHLAMGGHDRCVGAVGGWQGGFGGDGTLSERAQTVTLHGGSRLANAAERILKLHSIDRAPAAQEGPLERVLDRQPSCITWERNISETGKQSSCGALEGLEAAAGSSSSVRLNRKHGRGWQGAGDDKFNPLCSDGDLSCSVSLEESAEGPEVY